MQPTRKMVNELRVGAERGAAARGGNLPREQKNMKYPFGSAAACRRFGRLRLNIVMGTVLKRRQAAALHTETVSINGILVFSNSPMQKR